ncbi:MAG: ribosome assembly cofactor RimP [Prevotella sp.]|nr:ribosome assembly cofactor RimP [Prevotella sp.]
MITKETVKELVEKWLQQKGDYFLVDIEMSDDDRIVIEIDHADGVWIEDCAELSRFLQEQLGDELGDYELEVGSAGLGQPFKVEQQYVNHVGDDVEVIDADGKKTTGMLKQVEGRLFTVATQEKQIPEGKKRPVKVDVDKQFSMDEVKSTKYVLNFK